MKVRILDRSNLDVGVLVDEARLYFMTNNDVRERRAPSFRPTDFSINPKIL